MRTKWRTRMLNFFSALRRTFPKGAMCRFLWKRKALFTVRQVTWQANSFCWIRGFRAMPDREAGRMPRDVVQENQGVGQKQTVQQTVPETEFPSGGRTRPDTGSGGVVGEWR